MWIAEMMQLETTVLTLFGVYRALTIWVAITPVNVSNEMMGFRYTVHNENI